MVEDVVADLLDESVAHLLVAEHGHADGLRDVVLHHSLRYVRLDHLAEPQHRHLADVAAPLVVPLLAVRVQLPLLRVAAQVETAREDRRGEEQGA